MIFVVYLLSITTLGMCRYTVRLALATRNARQHDSRLTYGFAPVVCFFYIFCCVGEKPISYVGYWRWQCVSLQAGLLAFTECGGPWDD